MDVPEEAVNVPRAHNVQFAFPEVFVKLPCGHAKQEDAAVLFMNVPAEQGEQTALEF